MSLISIFIEYVLHIDQKLLFLVNTYGIWTYAILFIIIFCETGLVVAPFLPGDSMIFATGALAAVGDLNIFVLFAIFAGAAILGDTLNYSIGAYFGPKVFKEKARLFKKEYLDRTHEFYEKHGGKTIILARFIPIIRTFAPFVAGIGKMSYWRFLAYNVVGGLVWVGLFLFGGYFFGNIPFVQDNFGVSVIIVIIISFIPLIIEAYRHRHHFKKKVV